jgi:hypothetical protein
MTFGVKNAKLGRIDADGNIIDLRDFPVQSGQYRFSPVIKKRILSIRRDHFWRMVLFALMAYGYVEDCTKAGTKRGCN